MKIDHPIFTIGIPCYNGEEWLADAIESALNQPFSEVIVCDDGSTDNSLEIAKRFPVKVIKQVNKGLASARNSIIMNMQGQWFLPLDADDLLLDNCIEVTMNHMSRVEADIYGLSFKEIGLGSATIQLMPEPTLKDFRKGNCLPYCSIISKQALLEVGGYQPRMDKGYEDLHLWVNLLSRGKKAVTIPNILWLYRIRKDSMYRTSVLHHKELLEQINKDFPQALINF